MNSFFRYFKLSLFTIFCTGSIANAADDGGGLGTFVDGVAIGGKGGGADIWGGFGGTVVGQPPAATPLNGNGSDGVSAPGEGVIGRGGTAVVINNESDPLPERNPFNPSDGRFVFGPVVAGGGGGAVAAIINARTYTVSQLVVGGGGGYGGQDTDLDPKPIRGSGGSGIGIVFNGEVLNLTSRAIVLGGLGGSGTSIDIPPTGGLINRIVSGGGGVGLLVNSGTVNNAGLIRGGNAAAAITPLFGAQGGAGVYLKSSTTFNNNGTVKTSETINPNFSVKSAVIIAGNGVLFNNMESGKIHAFPVASNSPIDPVIYLEGDSNTIIQEGQVSFGPRTGIPGEAVQVEDQTIMISFKGNNNTLELRNNYIITGLVRSTDGQNHLVFGGETDNNFDLSKLGPAGSAVQYTGFADYKKTGSSKWIFNGTQGDTAPWTLESGTLSVLGQITGSMHAIAGRLQGTGSVGSLTHEADAIVAPGNDDFGTLTVNGSYIGRGGKVEISTALGDDISNTSSLIITGDTSGTTNVEVDNRGGSGAQTVNGIKVIDVGGQSDGTFTLLGDYTTKDSKSAVIAGAYAYTLDKTSSGSWVLASHTTKVDPPAPTPTPEPTPGPTPNPHPVRYHPGVPVYESVIQGMSALNSLPTLQQRVGNRYWNRAGNPVISQGDGPGLPEYAPAPDAGVFIDGNAVWARIGGSYTSFDANVSRTKTKQRIDTYFVQAGIDGQFYESNEGKLIGGLTGMYGYAKSNVRSFHGDGEVSSDAWGLGTTLTWYGETGFYVDGQAQVLWFDNNLYSDTVNTTLAKGVDAWGYALGLEVGQRFDINDYWSMTPQMQLTSSTLSMDSFRDTWEAKVSLSEGDNLTGRLGVSADYRNAWYDGNGQLVRTNLYGIANLYYEFRDKMATHVANEKFALNNDKIWGGLGAGGTYAWADGRYALYGEGLVNTSLKNFGDSYSVAGTIGFKVKW